MSKIKAILDFSGYSAGDLGPIAQTIHDSMLGNAATFTSPPVTMPSLQTLIDTFDQKLAAKASRATVDIAAFNDAREALEIALADLGSYVNQVAKGDATIVALSGFPSYDTARTIDTSPPAAPENLTVRQGDLSGSCVVRYRPDRTPSMNDIETCLGDPNVEANWKHYGTFSGGKATLDGFTPGTTVWIRVRTIGLKGVMGAWSDPGKIIVV